MAELPFLPFFPRFMYYVHQQLLNQGAFVLHASLRDAYSAIFRVARMLQAKMSCTTWWGGRVGGDGPQDYPASPSVTPADLFARLRRAEVRREIREHAERAERSKVAIFCAGVFAG